MTAPSSGHFGGDGASSSSGRIQLPRTSLDGLDGDEAADLSLDNALLDDDPLADDIDKTP